MIEAIHTQPRDRELMGGHSSECLRHEHPKLAWDSGMARTRISSQALATFSSPDKTSSQYQARLARVVPPIAIKLDA